MENFKKKILIAVIAFFCLFLLTVFGLGLKQKASEKSEVTQSELEIYKKRIENTAQIQKCVKAVGEMDFSKMVDLTEQLSKDLAFREKIKVYTYPFNLLTRYLKCKFLQEKDREKKNALVDYAMEARRRIFFTNQDEVWNEIEAKLKETFIRTEKSFITSLAFGEMAKICPSELPLACKRDNGVIFRESDEWCSLICETLTQYEKDKDKLNEEVINFKDWKEGIENYPSSPFKWRLAVAYRFGGKDLALKICDNVIDEQKKNSCFTAATSFETRSLSCEGEGAFEQLAQLICDYQYKNY